MQPESLSDHPTQESSAHPSATPAEVSPAGGSRSGESEPAETAHVAVRITPTISLEYENRSPDFIPEEVWDVGVHVVSIKVAREMLADAEYNSDPQAQEVGEYGTPLGVFNAYRALANNLRKAIKAAEAK